MSQNIWVCATPQGDSVQDSRYTQVAIQMDEIVNWKWMAYKDLKGAVCRI